MIDRISLNVLLPGTVIYYKLTNISLRCIRMSLISVWIISLMNLAAERALKENATI